MSNSIDTLWRRFLRGQNHTDIVEIIQTGMESFFSFLLQENIIEEFPREHIYYIDFKHAKDLTAVKKIFDLQLTVIGIKDTVVPGKIGKKVKRRLQRKFGITFDRQNEALIRLDQYDDFMTATEIIVKARNYDAHNPMPERNDSGWAVWVVSSIYKMIELTPVKIDKEKVIRLKANALELLKEVVEFESYDEDEENELESDLDETLNQDPMIEKFNDLEEKVVSFLESIEGRTSGIETLMLEETFPEHHFRRVLDDYMPKNDKRGWPSEEQQKEWSEPSEEQQKEWSKEEEKYGHLSPELTLEDIDEINEEQPESNRITEGQARRELLMLQKEIKKTFRCKNWENIAQGPFRDEITLNQITTKTEWLANNFIYNRYQENSFVMDNQLNSEVGDRYFDILKRIIWS